MLHSAKLLTLSLLVCVAIMGLPAMAGASTIFSLSEDGGAFTTVATGASLSQLTGNGTFGDFTYKIIGVSTDNTLAVSDILSSATSIGITQARPTLFQSVSAARITPCRRS